MWVLTVAEQEHVLQYWGLDYIWFDNGPSLSAQYRQVVSRKEKIIILFEASLSFVYEACSQPLQLSYLLSHFRNQKGFSNSWSVCFLVFLRFNGVWPSSICKRCWKSYGGQIPIPDRDNPLRCWTLVVVRSLPPSLGNLGLVSQRSDDLHVQRKMRM